MSATPRRVFGIAFVAFGVLGFVPHGSILPQPWASVVGAAEIAGGLAMQFRPTRGIGAAILAAVMVLLASLKIPAIIAAPVTYNPYGDLFEQLSLLCGAAFAWATVDPAGRAQAARAAYLLFGLCVISFALEQAVYLKPTAGLVPSWIPGQMFWAIATTVAFAAAAVAMLSGRLARTAAQLLAAMLLAFGVIVWLPHLFAMATSPFIWSETIETFAIAAVAWMASSVSVRPD